MTKTPLSVTRRSDLLTKLQKCLGFSGLTEEASAQNEPMLNLWRDADDPLLRAVIASFAQYTNLPGQLQAQVLMQGWPGSVSSQIAGWMAAPMLQASPWQKILAGMVADLRRGDVDVFSVCLRATTVLRQLSERPKESVLNYAQEWLKDEAREEDLVGFLTQTQALAMALQQQLSGATPPQPSAFYFAVYLRLLTGDGYRKKFNLLDNPNVPAIARELIDSYEVTHAVQEALALEDALRAKGVYPACYVAPFGAIEKKCLVGGHQPYYSARLACAALMLAHATTQTRPYCQWFFKQTTCKRGAADISPKDYSQATIEHALYDYFWLDCQRRSERPLACEYDNAHQWLHSWGKEGGFSAAATDLLRGTQQDAQALVRVGASVFAHHAGGLQVALACKLGAYFRDWVEPIELTGKKLGSTLPAKLRRLCPAPGCEDRGLADLAGQIYFEDWPQTITLKADVDWNDHGGGPWSQRCSNIREPGSPMDHLWRYGKAFQRAIDQAIADAQLPSTAACFVRHALLLPFAAGIPSKTLRDFPGAHPMRRILHYLGRSGATLGFELGAWLYRPIVFAAVPPHFCPLLAQKPLLNP